MLSAAEAPPIREQLTFFEMPVKEFLSRHEKVSQSRKQNTEARNKRINDRFNHLYNVERKRYDDVMEELKKEFCLALGTIERALKG